MTQTRAASLFVAAVVVATALVGPAVAAPAVQAAQADQPVEGEGGHRFDVGGNETNISVWLHLDLFTNLGAAGDFGFSAVGSAMDARVVAVDVQLRFDGVGDLSEFLSNPFSRFSVVAEWELDLPFLSVGPSAGDDFSFEGNETIDGRSA
ncbi:DUF7332 family protein [Halobacterium hubeiense]|uniref:DUF7332 family protein n=1 Tax=Halobacterium hubeiense TaxID=1407499 RepID=UPI003C739CF6